MQVRTIVIVVGLLILVSIFLIAFWADKGVASEERAQVIRVIDLDTLELEGGERVRLLCVNAPERQAPWTAGAEEKLRAIVVDQDVVMKRDISDRDSFGRLLRQVYVNGTWVQEFLVREGYARVTPVAPDKTACGLLEQARNNARAEGKGLWASKLPICDTDIYSCDDFADREQASALFAACGGSAHDIHGLDGDGDGEVCEELP